MWKTFVKFMIVGTLNGIIYFSLMYIFTSVIGVWYMASAVISVIVQTIITYTLHRLWVWKSKKVAIRSVINIYRFLKYCIIGGVGMVLGLCGLYIVTEIYHIYYMVSVIVASFILLVLNFLANYMWTWGENESKELNWIVNVLNRLGFMPVIKRIGVIV